MAHPPIHPSRAARGLLDEGVEAVVAGNSLVHDEEHPAQLEPRDGG